MSDDAAKYESLATDMVAVYATGEPAALARINQHYGRSSTAGDFRTIVWRRIYKVRQANGAAHAFGHDEAKELIAASAGFNNWATLIQAAAAGTPPELPLFAIHAKENRIAPNRDLVDGDWDRIIGVMREQRISALNAEGGMTDAALKRVSKLDHVTSLQLAGSRELSDDGVQLLAGMPQLEDLDLSGCKVTDRGLDVLRHLPELRRFKMVWHGGVSDAGVGNLRFCHKLEAVGLMGTPVGDGVLEALREKPNLRHLETGRLVTDAGLAFLREFPLFVDWQEPEGADHFTRLMIDGPFTDEGLASLQGLNGVSELDLFWHVTAVTPDGFAVLPTLSHLASLGCDGELSADRAMPHIAAIPNLRKIRAQGSVATDEGFVALSRSATLERFWGRECPNLTGRGFAAFSKMPSLRGLGVSLKNVDDAALSMLPSFPALRDLTPIDVKDDGFRHVGLCAGLERLSCMYCRDTTDVATEHVAGLRLKSYYAGLTQITDRSLEILSRMTSLESIELYETKNVTDAGIAYLTGMPNLRQLHLTGLPGVTWAGTQGFPTHMDLEYHV